MTIRTRRGMSAPKSARILRISGKSSENLLRSSIQWITYTYLKHTMDYIHLSQAYNGLHTPISSIQWITYTYLKHTMDYIHLSQAYNGLHTPISSIQWITYTYLKHTMDYIHLSQKTLSERAEFARPKWTVGMQNFTSCVAHAYTCVASENQALQLVYPFSSKGNATSELLHTKWYPQFISVVQTPFSPTTFFDIGVYK